MNWVEYLIVFLTFLANATIGIISIKKNPNSWTHRFLTILAFVLALWAVVNYIPWITTSEAVRLFWVRATMAITSFIGITTFLLAYVFPGDKFKMKKLFLLPLTLIALSNFLLSPFTFSGLNNTPGGEFLPVQNWPMTIFALNHYGFTLLGIIVLIAKFRKSTGVKRKQLGWMLAGLLLTLSLITASNFIAVTIFETVRYTFIGPTMTIFEVGFILYAIARHRFLDVTALIARTVSYTLLLLSTLSLYILLVFAASEILPTSTNKILIYSILTLLVALTFGPLKNLLEKITDKVFFKGRYDTEKLLTKLIQIMAAEIAITKLSNKLLTTLTKEMRLTKGAFVLIDEGKIQGIEQLNFEAEILKNEQLVPLLENNQESYIFEELAEEKVKDLFRKLNISAIFPLKVKTKAVGLLALGPKASGDIYSNQDLELLEIFAPQAAIALQNAESYRRIQSFSHTLERKVQERTKELKETQARELSKAKQLLKLKDEFVFIATHDLGTPVTAIKGFVHLLKNSKNKLSKDSLENIVALEQASNRLSTLTNDLLQVARSESEAIKIEVATIDIIALIKNILKQFGAQAKERKIKLKNKFHVQKCLVLADKEKLSEVIENLLSNAIKYNKEKGQVSIGTHWVKNGLQVDITDTGVGIPKKDHAKVFQKFSRIQQAGNEKITGTGLGLFVARMMIEKMKGKIFFTSTEKKGTTFSFVLPLTTNQSLKENSK
ncbi:MAG: ATP-binding protein [Patescibacteria group bacterium]